MPLQRSGSLANQCKIVVSDHLYPMMKHFCLDVFFRDDGAPHLKGMKGNRVVCWLVKVIMFQHTWELWGSLLRHQWLKKKKNWMRESFGSVVFLPSSLKDLQNWCQGRFKHLWRHPVAQNLTETLNAGFFWNLSLLCISSGYLLSQIFHIHHFLHFFSPFQQHYSHCNNRTEGHGSFTP